MKTYRKQEKSIPGWGYWGDNGEIEVGISAGYVATAQNFQPDKPHYHRTGTVYLLTLSGAGRLKVGDKEVVHTKDMLVRIDPGEIYNHVDVDVTPLSWITFCTVKDPSDKVVV